MVAPRRTKANTPYRPGWLHLSQEWPLTMKHAASAEGWHIWRYYGGELELRKNCGPEPAHELVQEKAHAGSIVAQKALSMIVKQKLGLKVVEGDENV